MPMNKFFGKRLPALVMLGIAACIPSKGSCQTYTPYSYFQGLSLADMGRIQVKITYSGIENLTLAPIAIAVPGNPMNLSLFVPFQRPGFDYGNDRFAGKSASASATELKAMIDSVGTIPEVTSGVAETLAVISFALLDTAGGIPKVFECIVGTTSARKLFGKLLSAVSGDGTLTNHLRLFGCAEGLLPAAPPSNVDGRVAVRFTGVRADRNMKGQFVGRVKVTNTSGTTIDAPVALLLLVSGTADLVGSAGYSCRTNQSGHPYLILALGAGLAPGATIERILRFRNPSLDKFDVSFHVFSGPGTM